MDVVKVAIRRQEEETRKKTAEALAMKAQYKQAQIETSINRALEGFTTEAQFGTFEAAAERIRDAKSEAAARQEMMSESIQGKVMAMEDKSFDYAAEEELKKLEQRLGMSTSESTEQATLPNVEVHDVDKQLEELENRMNQGQSG